MFCEKSGQHDANVTVCKLVHAGNQWVSLLVLGLSVCTYKLVHAGNQWVSLLVLGLSVCTGL